MPEADRPEVDEPDVNEGQLTLGLILEPSMQPSMEQTMELAPADRPPHPARRCPVCGTEAPLTDVFCQQCGLQLTNDRDHYSELRGERLAAVTDRGLRHRHNEDAAAIDLHRPEPGRPSLGVLVVGDGVSSAQRSELASLVAARAARDELRQAAGHTGADRATVLRESLRRAVVSADDQVRRQTEPDRSATTLTAAAVEADLVGWVSVGDSRVYWLPDRPHSDGPPSDEPDTDRPRRLSRDDSVAELRVAAGAERHEAERAPGAHAITQWIGADAPDTEPELEVVRLPGAGWLLVCSDGLWNYCSEPTALAELVAELIRQLAPGVGTGLKEGPTEGLTEQSPPSALALADALSRWANEQGGKDNVTVALARLPLDD